MKTLDWISKRQNISEADVSITKVSNGTNKKQISFRFRNNCYNRITANLYVVYAVDGDRIYFGMSKDKSGFKLCFSDNKFSNGMFKTTSPFNLDSFIGDYDLEHDRELKLCFIDKNKKLEGTGK